MKKKLISSILIMTLAVTTVLAGCGKDKKENKQAGVAKDYVYSETEVNLGIDSEDLYLSEIDSVGERILAVVTRYEETAVSSEVEGEESNVEASEVAETGETIETEEATETVEQSIEVVDAGVAYEKVVWGKEVTEDYSDEYESKVYAIFKQLDQTGQLISEFEWLVPDNGSYSAATLDGKGNVYILYSEYGAIETTSGEFRDAYMVKAFSEDGTELWNLPVGTDIDEGEWYYVNTINYLEDDKLFIHSSKGIELINLDGTYDRLISFEGLDPYDTLKIKNGGLCVICYSEMGLDLHAVDMAAGKVDASAMQLPFNLNNYTFFSGKGVDLYLVDASGVYTFSIGDDAIKKIMDFVDSDIAVTSLSELIPVDEESFYAARYDEESDHRILSLYRKVAPEDVPDKETLVLAGAWIDYGIRTDVVKFNKTSEKYRIRIEDYSQYNTPDDYSVGINKLNTDIVSGNVPDILYTTSEMPIDNYISKGLIADLNTFIESDPEIKKEDYLQNVFDVFSNDGKLYQLVPSFYAFTVYGKTADVGTTPGWTFDDLKALREKKGPEVETFSETTASSIIYYSMIFGGAEYINWETGECSFDSEEFIELLEFAKEFPVEIDYSAIEYDEAYWEAYDTMYREGRALLMASSIAGFYDFNTAEKGTFGEDVTLIGFPNNEKESGALAANISFAISAKSDYKDGAWQFLRYYLADEYQSTIDYGFPVKKSVLEKCAADARKKPSYEDENGQMVEYDNTYYLNGQEIIIPPMTQEETDELTQYISNINKRYTYSEEISSIIEEESAPFFEGQKSAKEVADIIQSRVQIYVNENR